MRVEQGKEGGIDITLSYTIHTCNCIRMCKCTLRLLTLKMEVGMYSEIKIEMHAYAYVFLFIGVRCVVSSYQLSHTRRISSK